MIDRRGFLVSCASPLLAMLPFVGKIDAESQAVCESAEREVFGKFFRREIFERSQWPIENRVFRCCFFDECFFYVDAESQKVVDHSWIFEDCSFDQCFFLSADVLELRIRGGFHCFETIVSSESTGSRSALNSRIPNPDAK